MPIYEYKGQQYDIATDDPAAAKSKILGYLEKQAAPAQAPTQAPTQGERTYGEAATDIGAGLMSGTGKVPANCMAWLLVLLATKILVQLGLKVLGNTYKIKLKN